MKNKLKDLKNIISENCVSIVLNTHRTSPDNEKDKLTLKNLIKEAEERLMKGGDEKVAKVLIDKLNQLESTIDHNYNMESLALYVNENRAEFVRLPIAVVDRVVVGKSFATRDLLRAMHLETNYYVLVLSQQKVRLIEAFNDKVVSEVGKPFPVENTDLHSTSTFKAAIASRQSNLLGEFYNRIDKQVNTIRGSKPLPVLICSEENNYHEYLKIADQRETIFDSFLNKNRLDEKAQSIVSDAWEIVKTHMVEKNNKRKAELDTAVGSGKFLSDTNEIWKAINEGRIQTVFVEQGLFQPARLENNSVSIVTTADLDSEGVVDDVFSDMIERNMSFGGDAVFLPKGQLDKFNGFGAITRY